MSLTVAYELLSKLGDLCKHFITFYEDGIDKKIMKESGEKFVLRLYGCGNSSNFDESRYSFYQKSVSWLSLSVASISFKSNFNMASLPPTSASVEQVQKIAKVG